MRIPEPTKRQERVLDAIEHLTLPGRPPSISELCVELEITRNGVTCHLNALRRLGLVDWVPRRERTLRTTLPVLGVVR